MGLSGASGGTSNRGNMGTACLYKGGHIRMLKIVELQACAADGCKCFQAMNCFAPDRMQVHQAFDREQQLAASYPSLQRLAVSQIDGQTWRRSETKQGLGIF